MEAIKNYLDKKLNEYSVKLEKSLFYIKDEDNFSIREFLDSNSHTAFQCELFIQTLSRFQSHLNDDNTDGIKSLASFLKNRYEQELLSAHCSRNSTCQIRNLLFTWEFESYPIIIRMLDEILKLCK